MVARMIGLLLLAMSSCQFGYGEDFPSTPSRLDECERRLNSQVSGWDFFLGVNPFYLRGDFDGDKRIDYVAQIVPEEPRAEACPDCSGVLFCMGSGAVDVLGSKLALADSALDHQYAIGSKWGIVPATDSEVASLKADGEVVLVVRQGNTSAIYLKESRYRWHTLHELEASSIQHRFLDDQNRSPPLPEGESLDDLFTPGWATDALAVGRTRTGLANILIRENHRSWLTSLSFCRGDCGGKKILAVASDNQIKLWNPLVGKLVRSLEGHTDRVDWVAFSPDGKQLASASRDQIRMWDAVSGQLLRVLEGSTGYGDAVVAFSPDGKWLVSGSDGHSVKLWDLVAGRLVRTLEGHKSIITSVAFSPDGRKLASASYDLSVKLWDLFSGRLLRTLEGHTGHVASLAFSPDGKWLASGGVDSSVKLWDPATGHQLRTLDGRTGYVESLAFSPDGKRLVWCGGHDQSIKLWDPLSGRLLRSLEGHTGFVKAVAFSPDGKWVASGSIDGTVKLWGRENEPEITLAMFEGSEWISFTPNGYYDSSDGIDRYVTFRVGRQFLESKQYASVGKRPEMIASVLKTLDIRNNSSTDSRMPEALSQCVDRLNSETGGFRLRSHVTPLYLRGDFDGDDRIDHVVQVAPTNIPCPGCGGALFCFGSGEIEVVGKNLKSSSGALPIHLVGARWRVLSVADPSVSPLKPDGQAVLMARANGPAVVYLENGRYKWYGRESSIVESLEKWSFPHVQPSSASEEGRGLKELPVAGRREVPNGLIPEPERAHVLRVAYSPGRNQLALGHSDASIRLWDSVTGRFVETLGIQNNGVRSLAYSRDGKQLASGTRGSGDGIKLWSVATRPYLRALITHKSRISHLAFRPDGKQLASGTADRSGDIRLWDTETGRQLRTWDGPWHWHGVSTLAYSPDGEQLASAHGNRIVLWDVATGRHLSTLDGHWRAVNCLTYSPDGKQLASGGDDYSVRVWDARTGRQLHTLRGHNSLISHVAYSPDGRYLASSGVYSVKIWEARDGRYLRTLLVSQSDTVGFVAFTRDGRHLIAQSEGYLQIWGSERTPAVSLVAFRSGGWASFTPDGYYDGSPEADLYMAHQVEREGAALKLPATISRSPNMLAKALRESDIRNSLREQARFNGGY